MTIEKFESELDSLDKFFSLYCKNKHINQKDIQKDLIYKNHSVLFKTNLCAECEELLNYSISRLEECPHEQKPRCRSCKNPCYDRDKWKQVAKVMKYSGIKLGLSKLKKAFRLKADI